MLWKPRLLQRFRSYVAFGSPECVALSVNKKLAWFWLVQVSRY